MIINSSISFLRLLIRGIVKIVRNFEGYFLRVNLFWYTLICVKLSEIEKISFLDFESKIVENLSLHNFTISFKHFKLQN